VAPDRAHPPGGARKLPSAVLSCDASYSQAVRRVQWRPFSRGARNGSGGRPFLRISAVVLGS